MNKLHPTQTSTPQLAQIPASPDPSAPGDLPRERARSFYQQLTPEQSTQLWIWLRDYSLAEVQRRVAAPPPEGFGLHTHTTTLHRLRVTRRAVPAISRISDMLEKVEEIEVHSNLDQLGRIQRVIANLLHDHALDLAEKRPDSDSLPRTVSAIEKLCLLEYRRQKLALARESLLRADPSAPKRHRVDLNIVRSDQPSTAPNPPPCLPAENPSVT